MDDLENVYILRQRINRLEYKLKSLTCENIQNNRDMNKQTVARINKIEARIIKLKGIHNDKIYDVYSGLSKRPKSAPIINEIQMKISEIDIGDNITILKMTPISFKLDEKKSSLKDIIYPTDGTDRNLINTVARYRTIINKSKDFRHQPLEINQNSIETIIIALDIFARQYGGELSFTNEDRSFSDSIESLACGIANLGSIHLLTAEFLPTAKFSLKLNLHYDRDLTQSNQQMKRFIFDFSKSIARVLQCRNDFIRIFSIERIQHKRGLIKVNFGLTTPNKNQTISLARHFQNLIRRLDFQNDKILRYIQSDNYRYELIPTLSYLQLSPKDFDTLYNYDYRQTELSKEDKCGKYPYYHPIGWYRHAINLNNKYSDDQIWFGHQNIDGEWPIAFHGTHSRPISENEDNDQIAMIDAGSSLYVRTHCNDGADAYTTPFTISNGDNNETFKIVFQCRVKPNSFTIHTGGIWQITDPQAIRPYGLLLKNETVLA